MVKTLLILATIVFAGAEEADYYRIVTLPTPEGVAFEVSGLEVLDDGRVAIAIRKGEVWVLENPHDPPEDLRYTRIATALHEPLGLLKDGADLLLAQRSEVTRLRDQDGDGIIDAYLTEGAGWGLTGNYHEYAYGPERDGQGRLWVTLNQTIGETPNPKDNVWRGWGAVINADHSITPMCAGMRSPCGLGANAAGDMFFTDQQGNWVPTNSLHHLRQGAFYGHVESLEHAERPGSPVVKPERIEARIPLPEAVEKNPTLSLPAIWFPYRKMGMSATDILCDQTGGKFGPFSDQLFVGDFTMAQVNRVFLEKVNGEYQGTCFPFRSGFQSAALRMAFGPDGSMYVGETNRGWNSTGRTSYGLERLEWTGKVPFEILSMHAEPDGFRLRFTKPVDPATASDPASYTVSSYTYEYHHSYGSEEIDAKDLVIEAVNISDEYREVQLLLNGLREYYVHELHAKGIRSVDGEPLLHPDAYYTLNSRPAE